MINQKTIDLNGQFSILNLIRNEIKDRLERGNYKLPIISKLDGLLPIDQKYYENINRDIAQTLFRKKIMEDIHNKLMPYSTMSLLINIPPEVRQKLKEVILSPFNLADISIVINTVLLTAIGFDDYGTYIQYMLTHWTPLVNTYRLQVFDRTIYELKAITPIMDNEQYLEKNSINKVRWVTKGILMISSSVLIYGSIPLAIPIINPFIQLFIFNIEKKLNTPIEHILSEPVKEIYRKILERYE